jgi:DNA repair exonuclease SbcCD ATPase subunit
MKNLFFSIIALSVILMSCNQAEVEQLKQENESLKTELEQRNQDINNFMEVFNDIEENLAQVRAKEQLIVKQAGSSETGFDRVEAVKSDIRAIDQLMKQNKENLKNLSGKLKDSKTENKEIKRMLDNLEKMIVSKDMEILSLVNDLESLNFEVQELYTSVADLRAENIKQGRVIDLQEAQLSAAYYIIGTEKDLKENGVITKQGGFIGIGRVEKMIEDVNDEIFTKIDIRKQTIFPIDAKKVTLVTTHPPDSYIIRKNEDTKRYYSFEVTKPEEFWKTSKYLVISVKE